jgi:hypothetical protein
MKYLLACLLPFLITISVSAEPSNILKGTFVDLEFGDYAHVQVEDASGSLHSFWLGNDRSLSKFVDNPESFKGKQVKVYWHTVKRNVPEAGGEIEIEEATRIDVLETLE